MASETGRTTTATRLSESIADPEVLVLPGVHDALSAILAERAGFDAVFTSGFGLSASALGLPDVGLMTASENLARVAAIARRVSVPTVADLDTGYGSALNVRRVVSTCLDAGVAGVVLEDQVWPKKCGHMEEKRVVPAPEHARRIRAAADVRAERDADLVIVARTDAAATHDLDEAIARGQTYHEAGADVVFVEAPESRDALARVAAGVDAPLLANMVEGGKTPVLPAGELSSLGFDVALYPVSGLFAATKAVGEAFETLARDGTSEAVDAYSFADFESVIGLEGFREREQRYADLYRE